MNNYQPGFPGGAINPAVLAAFPTTKQPKFSPAPTAPPVSPAQLINAAQSTLQQRDQQARQQKMDEQRQAARMQILQQGMGMNMGSSTPGMMLPPSGIPRGPMPMSGMRSTPPSRAMSSTPVRGMSPSSFRQPPPFQQTPTPQPRPTSPPKRKLPQSNGQHRIKAESPRSTTPVVVVESNDDDVPTAAAAPAAAIPTLPPLPPLPSATTHITIVPLLTSSSTIPPLSTSEINDIKDWMRVDRDYEGVFRGMKERMMREAAARPRGWWEKGFVVPGLGGDAVGNRWRRGREVFEVRYPRRKDRERRRGKREGLRLPRKLDIRDVNKPEQLVPIRLEFDVEHHKMRDTFVWNLNDPVVTPEAFAQSVVEDYALSPSYHAVITKSIQDQLSDYRAHSGVFDPENGDMPMPVVDLNEKEAEPTKGRFDEGEGGEEGKWWASWKGRVCGKEKGRKRRKRRKVGGADADADEGVEGDVEDGDADDGDVDEDDEGAWGEKGKTVDEMEVDEAKMYEEMRILIRLDIIVGSMKLDDQFEWDLESESVTPEEFAEVYVQDLGLTGEFKTAIAHSIREQIQTYQKSLFLIGHTPRTSTPIPDDDLRLSFLPPLASATRAPDAVHTYTPTLNYLSDTELDRTSKEREKDISRRMRKRRRGGVGVGGGGGAVLPDREPARTCRTPAIGFPELDPAVAAAVAAASAPVSRRAAAAAASLTIASMVASENGTQVVVPSMAVGVLGAGAGPGVGAAGVGGGVGGTGGGAGAGGAAGGKATRKGRFFKAPVYPSEVLGPRARTGVPVASTATPADVEMLEGLGAGAASGASVSASISISASAAASTSLGTDNGRAPRYVTAKRAKELEREAKEKEYAEGQHANMRDGVWHCSNCGCPDSIAVGRRKGPLGDKSQCGVCGKYWHRHRRPRPVEYNPDPEYHTGLKREMEQSKAVASAKKKGGAAARTQTHTPAETSEPQTPRDLENANNATTNNGNGGVDPTPTPVPDSPVSTASSGEEQPLAQRVKTNGAAAAAARRVTSPPAGLDTPVKVKVESSVGSPSKPGGGKPGTLSPMSALKNAEPPQWLSAAKTAMMARYPNDKFETILRKVNAGSQPEWRIKCLDCPGKLYTPGPGETLANYEVHLKNRQHRQRVNDRLNNEAD